MTRIAGMVSSALTSSIPGTLMANPPARALRAVYPEISATRLSMFTTVALLQQPKSPVQATIGGLT